MKDLLEDYAEAWRAGQPAAPDLPPGLFRSTRRRPAAAVAVVGPVVISAVSLGVLARHDSPATRPSLGPAVVTVAPALVTVAPAPVSPAPPSTCSFGDLHVGRQRSAGGETLVPLTDVTACTLPVDGVVPSPQTRVGTQPLALSPGDTAVIEVISSLGQGCPRLPGPEHRQTVSIGGHVVLDAMLPPSSCGDYLYDHPVSPCTAPTTTVRTAPPPAGTTGFLINLTARDAPCLLTATSLTLGGAPVPFEAPGPLVVTLTVPAQLLISAPPATCPRPPSVLPTTRHPRRPAPDAARGPRRHRLRALRARERSRPRRARAGRRVIGTNLGPGGGLHPRAG